MIGRRLLHHGRRHHAAAALILAASSLAAYLLGAAFAVRGWSRWVAHAVGGEPPAGAVLGFCCGTLFTVVPAMLAWVVTRSLLPWAARAGWLAVAALLAGPNLLTLAAAVGSGSGAAAARHAMDLAAPMFRGATLAGAGFALLTVLAMMLAFRFRRIPWHRPA